MTEEKIQASASRFSQFYANDVSEKKLNEEVIDLKMIQSSNFGHETLAPLSLLNRISVLNLSGIFPNVRVVLRIFCTIPATVASAERSFSKLKMIKNYLRSTMTQDRLNDLAILSIESDLAREVDFQTLSLPLQQKRQERPRFKILFPLSFKIIDSETLNITFYLIVLI